LQEESRSLRTEQHYEVISLAISTVLNKLDACTVFLWELQSLVDGNAREHVLTHGGGSPKGLDESVDSATGFPRARLRESDMAEMTKRIRQQEANILQKKMLKWNRVFALVEKGQNGHMREGFRTLKLRTQEVKRYNQILENNVELLENRRKRRAFDTWTQKANTRKNRSKAMNRIVRIYRSRYEVKIRRYFKTWQNQVKEINSANNTNASDEVARLKLEVCNLKATLHDLSSKSEIAANFTAEKAYNRELSAMNMELRAQLQNNEMKMLDIAAHTPVGRKRELVHKYLIEKVCL
jgi:hypothetical protein